MVHCRGADMGNSYSTQKQQSTQITAETLWIAHFDSTSDDIRDLLSKTGTEIPRAQIRVVEEIQDALIKHSGQIPESLQSQLHARRDVLVEAVFELRTLFGTYRDLEMYAKEAREEGASPLGTLSIVLRDDMKGMTWFECQERLRVLIEALKDTVITNGYVNERD
ncbi:hypothetical protein HBH64_155330 [Parastagonospora nodorum]|nr:hypothetical protein HBH53_119020 [Parastagonospora nodorum]KAH4295758.1 hypothetical protein HBI01_152990 [Parastagonospora nodorum]KAH4326287.1 hypothetical protein HBI00_143860 [Parastagonospora nodorum]KAH4364444.1 hypothetical protein HBH94_163380 [Parastagonospora nodorum]KAH4460732.1 hypothetical protein HBH90_142990 [Parastagonospora nodorum]